MPIDRPESFDSGFSENGVQNLPLIAGKDV